MNRHQEALNRIVINDYLYFDEEINGYRECKDTKRHDLRIIQELVDKETPIKVLDVSSNVLFGDLQSIGTCPNCNKEIFMSQNIWYRLVSQYNEDEEVFIRCHHCGQKLDWSEDE